MRPPVGSDDALVSGQSDASFGVEQEERIERHFPEVAVRIDEVTGHTAPERLLRSLDDGSARRFSRSQRGRDLIFCANVVGKRVAPEKAVFAASVTAASSASASRPNSANTTPPAGKNVTFSFDDGEATKPSRS